MASFNHFLLTRFNLLSPGAELADAWYEQRFELFEQFCLPSVRGQTNQDFRWLLFADERTPDVFRGRLEGYRSDANIEVCYLKGVDRVRMVQLIRARLDDAVSHLITTTLDNDDAIARAYMAQVQAQFAAQDFELVNFLRGLRYDLAAEKLYALELETNPFISLVEAIGANRQFRSIIGCLPHSLIKERFSAVRNVSSEPLWLQVIHGRNEAPTGTWGWPRVPRNQLSASFELGYDLPREAEESGEFRVQRTAARLEREVINSLSEAQRRRIREWLQRQRR